MSDTLEQRVESAEERLEALWRRLSQDVERPEAPVNVLEEVSVVLEELRGVREGLRARDDEVTAVRRVVAAISPGDGVAGGGAAEQCGRLLTQVQRDRELAEELARALERERQVLQAIMDNTHAQLAYLDPQFNFVRVNSAYAQGAGYSEGELVGRNHFELFPHAENQAVFERVRETGEQAVFRAKPFVYPDRPELGTTYWDWALVPVKDADGQVQGLVLSLLDVTERERARQALLESEERFRTVADFTHDWEYWIGPDGDYLYVSPSCQRITGYSADEFRRDPELMLSIVHPADRELVAEHLGQALESSERMGVIREHYMDFRILTRDGEQRWISHVCQPVYSGDGTWLGRRGSHRDITKRRQGEEVLRRYAGRIQALHEMDQVILVARSAEEVAEAALSYLRRLVPCLWAGVAVFDPDTGEMRLLAALADRDTRLARGWRGPADRDWIVEALGRGRASVIEDVQGTSSSAPLLEALQAEGVRSYLSMPLTVQGEPIAFLILGMESPGRLTPEQADIGHASADVDRSSADIDPDRLRSAASVDIDHASADIDHASMEVVQEVANELAIGIRQVRLHRKVQQHADDLERLVATRTRALRVSEARFRAVFEEAGIGIALLDRKGRLEETNPTLQGMLGYEAEELRGRVLTELAHPDDATSAWRPFEELMAGTRGHYPGRTVNVRVDGRFLRKDGRPRWTNLVVTSVRRGRGNPRFAIAMVEDITEQKKAQAALIQTEKLAVTGKLAASLAHEINNPLQAVIGCLGLAQEALAEGEGVDRYLQIALEELRRAAGIVARFRDLHRPSEAGEMEPTDVNVLLEQVLALTEKRCKDRQIEVVYEADADLPALALVADRIQQVFLNLVLNAVDAMSEGGQLQIGATRTDQPAGVRVSFGDSGVGIAPDTIPHVFEPFYTTKPEGLGLGLYVSRNIVEDHGGRLEVESQVGQGTTFTVWLPAESRASAAQGGR